MIHHRHYEKYAVASTHELLLPNHPTEVIFRRVGQVLDTMVILFKTTLRRKLAVVRGAAMMPRTASIFMASTSMHSAKIENQKQ